MRLRECLTITALLTVTMVSAKGNPPAAPLDGTWDNPARDEQPRNAAVAVDPATVSHRESGAETNVGEMSTALPSPLVLKDKVLGSAYFDTLRILSANNACSDFFGGPAAAVDVFKQLIGNVRREYFANKIGMTMSGETTNVHNARTNRDYRLFSKVAINANGPFYRKRSSPSEPPMPRFGSFDANTKEVRVLMFLHELGHSMKGDDGNWLLPNDGKSDQLSHQNTQKIEDVCGDQIKDLDHEGKPEQPSAATAPGSAGGAQPDASKKTQ